MSIRYQSLRILFFGRIGAGSIRTLDVYCSIIRDGALWGPAPARIYILADLVFLSILVSKVRLVTVSCLGGRCAIAAPAILVSLVSLGSVAILVSIAGLIILVSLVGLVILVILFGLVRLISALKW